MSIPVLRAVLPLAPRAALRDALAGATLASMNIPQVLGYTRIAGTPVVSGLYTVLLPLVGFALFGSSRHLVVAADSATAAIFSSAISRMAPIGSDKYMALVGMLTLLTAALLLLARIFKLGFLADFLARTALVGFLAGVGVQVAIAMLGGMLGLDVVSRRTPVQAWEVATGLGGFHPLTLAISAGVVAAVFVGKWLVPRVPVAMVVVLGMIAASWWFDLAGQGVAVVGEVPGGLPELRWPDVSWRETIDLLPVAASCFVMIIAQSAATARVYGVRHRERVDENADILGIAAANAGAALTGAFVVNGSPTQTAMADAAGARSQFAQLVFAAIVAIVLLALTGPLQYLPRSVLASLVFTIAVGMIDIRAMRAILRESRGEFWLALATAVAVPAVGVQQGILFAIALSLVRHVRHSYAPHMLVLMPDPKEGWALRPAQRGEQTRPGLIIYRFGADLFYANADRFADGIRTLIDGAPDPVEWLVIDASAITDIDYSAAVGLRDLLKELAARKVNVAFGRVTPALRDDLERHGVAEVIGEGRLLRTLHAALALADGAPSR